MEVTRHMVSTAVGSQQAFAKPAQHLLANIHPQHTAYLPTGGNQEGRPNP